jgi:hypothetical protein
MTNINVTVSRDPLIIDGEPISQIRITGIEDLPDGTQCIYYEWLPDRIPDEPSVAQVGCIRVGDPDLGYPDNIVDYCDLSNPSPFAQEEPRKEETRHDRPPLL